MAYFPFFVELSGAEGLIVGGSTVARRKIEKLLPYGPRLTVCAPDISEEIRSIPGLRLLERAFVPELLEEKAFVIAATDSRPVNHRVSRLCRERRIPVNVVDDREACSFLFPALVKRGSLSVGISTGGASPSAAIYWKKRIDGLVPEDTGDLLDYLDGLRERVKQAVPDEMARAGIFSILFHTCVENGWPLSGETLDGLLGGPGLLGGRKGERL